MISFILCVLIIGQDSIPYKPTDEFEIKLDYQFKPRPTPSAYEFNFDESPEEHKKRTSTTPLPYLTLDIEILKASAEEGRIIGFRNGSQFLSKRGVKSGMQLEIEMGYTVDMKDRVTPHEYTLIFMKKDKSEISKIVILVEEDGSFFVNGEKRGKF